MDNPIPQPELFAACLEKIENVWKGLPDKSEENPLTTLRALWFFAAGNPRAVTLAVKGELPGLNGAQQKVLEQVIEQRLSGTPLAYLTGRQEFMGIEFLTGPGAMIPRKETEIVGKAALEAVRETARARGTIQVVDLCTGSGNLALALACLEPNCRVTGSDLSLEAVELARQNAAWVEMAERVDFLSGDLLLPFDNERFVGKIDVMICNPPYISSAQVEKMPAEISGYEPELAFDGGPFGIKILTRLVREAPRFLKPDSWLCFEVGLGQGAGLQRTLERNPAYQAVKTYSDEKGEIRALAVQTIH